MGPRSVGLSGADLKKWLREIIALKQGSPDRETPGKLGVGGTNVMKVEHVCRNKDSNTE